MLAEAEVNQKDMVGWYNLHGCATCPRDSRCLDVPKKSSFGILGYDDWPTCPVSLLRGPHWQHIVTLYNCKTVSPLSEWPQGYAAWVVDGLTALEDAFNRKSAKELKSKGNSRGRNFIR